MDLPFEHQNFTLHLMEELDLLIWIQTVTWNKAWEESLGLSRISEGRPHLERWHGPGRQKEHHKTSFALKKWQQNMQSFPLTSVCKVPKMKIVEFEKQCRSRWGGSLWATSPGSTLFCPVMFEFLIWNLAWNIFSSPVRNYKEPFWHWH